MLTCSHAIVAGTVGEYIGNPFLAFLVGIIIHFTLDSIPHYDTTDDGKITKRQLALVFADLIVLFLIVFFVIKPPLTLNSSFFWGALGGVFPDLFDCVPFWNQAFRRTKFGKKVHWFHERIQTYWKQPGIFFGISIQVIFVIVFTLLAVAKK